MDPALHSNRMGGPCLTLQQNGRGRHASAHLTSIGTFERLLPLVSPALRTVRHALDARTVETLFSYNMAETRETRGIRVHGGGGCGGRAHARQSKRKCESKRERATGRETNRANVRKSERARQRARLQDSEVREKAREK